MKNPYKLLTVLLLAGVTTSIHAQRGQEVTITQNTPWYVDAGVAYGKEIEEFGIRLGGGYDFPTIQRLRIASNFIYYFTDSNVDFYTASVYAQFSLIQGQAFDFYGIGGATYTRNKVSNPVFGSRSDDDIGFLFGGGAEFHITHSGSIYADLTYNTGDYDQMVVSAGFRYFF